MSSLSIHNVSNVSVVSEEFRKSDGAAHDFTNLRIVVRSEEGEFTINLFHNGHTNPTIDQERAV